MFDNMKENKEHLDKKVMKILIISYIYKDDL